MGSSMLTNQSQWPIITGQDSLRCEHMAMLVALEEEEKMEEMHMLPGRPALKDALMALSVFDSVISSHDANMIIAKAMDELKVSVPKLIRTF
jgi:hypothetical protein